MRRAKFVPVSLLLAPILLAVTLKPAKAEIVFDPSNFSQNILQAIRSLESNLNEARMIANQVQQLANDLRNLEKLPRNIVEDFRAQFQELFSAVGSVHGLIQNLSNLQSKFDVLYPDYMGHHSPVPGEEFSEKAEEWLRESRAMMLQSSITGAKVLEDLPRTHRRLEELLADSGDAIGILQATQAGNQIAATVAGNLSNLSAQLATNAQAHNSFLMQFNSGAAAGRQRMKHILDSYKPSTHPGVPLNSY